MKDTIHAFSNLRDKKTVYIMGLILERFQR